jgi:DnaJ-like protein
MDRPARYTRKTMTRAEALRIFELDDRRTQEEVRAAYRELVKVWHPDRFANDPDLRAKADRRLQDINRAYAVLQDGAQTVEPLREPTPPPPRAATPPQPAAPPPAATPRSAAHSTPRRADQWIRAHWSLALLVTVGLLTGAAVVGIVLMVVGPTRQAPAPRPISGTDLLASPLAGDGSLVVMNADGRDAVLVFVDSGVPTRAVYIRAGERLQMLDVAPGAHHIWVAAGQGWRRDHFATDQMFQEIAEPLTFPNDASAPPTITIAARGTDTRTPLRARSSFILNTRR